MQYSRYANDPAPAKGPEVFYGYCHDSRRMRMMDYDDFMSNLNTGYNSLYQPPAGLDAVIGAARPRQHGCHCHEQEYCSCNCCIQCADVVEYAYCGETRKIPITFDNDSRRERQVTLQIGGFTTDGGRQLPWKASLSDATLTLGPCSQKHVLVTVDIDCGQGNAGNANAVGTAANAAADTRQGRGTVDSCTVGYARLAADGCLIRPLIIAIAVLPDHCRAHRVSCLCGCC
jgi:hypothetical protein